MIEMPNVELLSFRDMLLEDKLVTGAELAKMDPDAIGEIPIQIRVGAVKYTIGVINTFRVGANAMTGDLLLELRGRLVMSLDGDRPKPISYEFTVDRT